MTEAERMREAIDDFFKRLAEGQSEDYTKMESLCKSEERSTSAGNLASATHKR